MYDKFSTWIAIGAVLSILIIGFVRILRKDTGTWSTKLQPDAAGQYIPKDEKSSKGELRCKYFAELYFKKPFERVRPEFLRNHVTGGKQNLELDCFNPELKLAIEYNGEQHYNYIPFFHSSREAFLNQKYRDELKKVYCRENGITLIEVPYNVKNIETFLSERFDDFISSRRLSNQA
jgi:hypothetical protein